VATVPRGAHTPVRLTERDTGRATSTIETRYMTTTETPIGPASPSALFDDPPGDRKSTLDQVNLFLFIIVPFLALVAAVPLLWGVGLSWRDVVIAVVFYALSGHGVTVGFHRCLTHRSFEAKRWLRVALAVAGSMAIEGPAIRWVADHRKHHRYSDRPGDPHSPWRYGTNAVAVTKGFFHAHLGWLFDIEHTPLDRYAPDLVQDRSIQRVSQLFPVWVAASLLLPPLIGGLWSWSWWGAFTAFFWGSLVRIALLHHVTFSINSVCHVTGRHPFKTRDRSANVWWLAVPSFGEAWHNFHHAVPTSARHGVRRLELDSSAVVIRVMERLRWVTNVRWPDPKLVSFRRALAPADG
jgi:stearoyl-CoA desaturase (Delta-9 desaturase)